MAAALEETNVYTSLRDRAEAQLQAGTTPKSGPWAMGVDVLRLLHDLSSNPGQASDALKLLHELQVHQVELDLQHEELAANEQALSADLGLCLTLFDHAPLAYLVMAPDGAVIQGNLAAAELFGVGAEPLTDHRLDTFLSPASRPLLQDLLQRVAASGASDCCSVETVGCAHGSPHLKLVASRHPERAHILLVCCECGNNE